MPGPRRPDWLEGLVKAYVGDGIAADFYRLIAQLLDQPTRSLVQSVLADSGHAQFAITRVREAIAADPAVAGRLALWARRLVGEALSQAQRVAAEREPLARLLAGGSPAQLGEIGRMFAELTDAHAQRMAALGLAAVNVAAGQSGLRSRSGAVLTGRARRRRSCRLAP